MHALCKRFGSGSTGDRKRGRGDGAIGQAMGSILPAMNAPKGERKAHADFRLAGFAFSGLRQPRAPRGGAEDKIHPVWSLDDPHQLPFLEPGRPPNF